MKCDGPPPVQGETGPKRGKEFLGSLGEFEETADLGVVTPRGVLGSNKTRPPD